MRKNILLKYFFFIPWLGLAGNLRTGTAPSTRTIVAFTENKGQVHDQWGKARPDVLFGVQAGPLAVHIKNNGVSYQLHRTDSRKASGSQTAMGRQRADSVPQSQTLYRIDLSWLNAQKLSSYSAGKALPGYNNYYLESCPGGALYVKSYEAVTLHNVYPGIDVHYYSSGGELEHDYLVAPGCDYRQIQIKVTGASVKLQRDGSLLLTTPLGGVQESLPKVYQGNRRLKARWRLSGQVLSFDIEQVNPLLPLRIDPVTRQWGTYCGGPNDDEAKSCKADVNGDVYIAGTTNANSGTLIATTGAHQSAYGGGSGDAFLVKFNSSGIRLWGTYYGGSDGDEGSACATDASGNVYLAGYTSSTVNIANNAAFQNAYGGGNYDAFLVKFNTSGVRQWVTYYGGTGSDIGTACATDVNGYVYMAGYTASTVNIASPGAFQGTYGGGTNDGFLVKFNTIGTRQWGTYYGGTSEDIAEACATDANGNLYLAGYTSSGTTTLIATSGVHQSSSGGSIDGYLAKFNSGGTRAWGTYYGGAADDYGYACTTDAGGSVYLSGSTSSGTGTLIATTGAQQSVFGGGNNDAFLVKFTNSGLRSWGTYYGDTGDDVSAGCATDASSNVYLSGYTTSSANIASTGAYQSSSGGNNDAMLAKFNSSGIRQWGTYYGGTSEDDALACTTDGSSVYMAGMTRSNNGIGSNGVHQSTKAGNGNFDAFLAKFDDEPAGALDFDGVNDKVAVSSGTTTNFGTGDMTVELWMRTSVNDNTWRGILSKTTATTVQGYQLLLLNGKLIGEVGNGPTFIGLSNGLVSSYNVNDGNWHHVAMVVNRSQNNVKLYVDGQQEASVNHTVVASLNLDNTSNLELGIERLGVHLNCSLDELRLWSTARSQCQIQTYMNCEVPVSAPGLRAYYKFNQGVAYGSNPGVTTLTASTASVPDGTLTNFALSGQTSNWVVGAIPENYTVTSAPGASLTVSGNGNAIPFGSVSPSTSNFTDFGSALSRNFAIANAGTGTLTIGQVFFTGTSAPVFSVSLPGPSGNLAGAASQSLQVVFSPTATGTSSAIVNLITNDCTYPTFSFVITASASPASALNFDGVNDYAQAPNAPGLMLNNALSVEAWAKIDDLTGINYIVSKGNTDLLNGQYGLLIMNGVPQFHMSNGAHLAVTGTFTATPGMWNHYAGTWDGSTMKLYVNGVLNGTGVYTGNLGGANNQSLNIGWLPGLYQMAGSVDELRIWNNGRSQCDIQAYMNCEIPTTAPGLVVNYHFNQGIASGINTAVTTLTDAAGANNATLNNFALTGAASNWVRPGGVADGYTVATTSTVSISVTGGSICAGGGFTLSPVGASTYTWSGGYAGTGSVVTVSPGATTSYSVIGTTTAGCTASAVAIVTVNSLPTIALSSGTVCAGNNFTLSATGANSYTWSTGANGSSNVVSPSVTTSYSVTGTNTLGCIGNAVATVTANNLPVVSVSGGTTCAGSNFTLAASGGLNNYTWNTGATSSSLLVSPSVTTSYSVTGTNTLGCTGNAVATITVNSLPVISVSGGTMCAGSNFTLAASGVNSYTWNTGAVSSSIVVSPTTTASYSVSGTTAAGCTGSVAVTLTVYTVPAIALSGGTVCAGSGFTLNASGVNTYTWSMGATSNSIVVNPSVTTSYSVNGTNTTGCVGTASAVATVTANAVPSIALSGGTVCAGGSFTLNASGVNTYTWSTGAISNSIIVSPSVTTSYSVSGTNTTGCVGTASAVASVTTNAVPVIALGGGTVCAGNNFTLSASGANSYTWSGVAGTGNTAIVSPSVTSSYSVTGSSAAGCSSSLSTVATVSVYNNPTLTVNSGSICSTNNLTLAVTGASTYVWSTGANSSSIAVSPAVTSIYSVTGTSSAGCTNSTTATVTVFTANSIVPSNTVLCIGYSTTVSVNCTAPSYTWIPANNIQSPLNSPTVVANPTATTIYSVIAASPAGCISSATLELFVVKSQTVAASGVFACANSSFQINANATYTGSSYLWQGPGTFTSAVQNPTRSAATATMAGLYTVTVISAPGCTSTAVADVTVGALPSLTITNTGSCPGLSTILSASGAVSYTWNTGAISSTVAVSPTVTSNYTATGTGTNGCTSSAAGNVTVNTSSLNNPENISNSFSATACGLNYVSSSLRLHQRSFCSPLGSGSAQPGSFLISGLPICAKILKAFLYTSMESNGPAVFNLNLTNPVGSASVVTTSSIGTAVSLCWNYGRTVSYRADVTNLVSGNGSYQLSGLPVLPGANDADGATLFVIYTDETQNYTGSIVIADGLLSSTGGASQPGHQIQTTYNGLPACATPSVAEGFLTVCDLQGAGNFVAGLNSAAATVTVAAAAQLPWMLISQTITPPALAQNSTTLMTKSLADDCYGVVMSGLYYRYGCLSCPSAMTVTASSSTCQPTGTASVNVTAGMPSLIVSWLGTAQTGSVATGLAAGIRSVTVSDAFGCKAPVTQTVNVVSQMSLTATGSSCVPNNSATAIASGGLGNYTYTWTSSAQTSSMITWLPTGTHTVTVSDAGACQTKTATFNVTASSSIAATNTALCIGYNTTLTVSGALQSYTWLPTTNIISPTNSPTVIANPNVTTIYTITATNSVGCISTNTLQLFVVSSQTVSIINATTCANSTLQLLANASYTGATYQWQGPGGFSSLIKDPALAPATLTMSGPYNVTVVSAPGCTSTAVSNVTVFPLPTTPTITSNAPICSGQTLSLQGSGGGNGVNYLWSGPGTFTSNLQSVNISSVSNQYSGNYTLLAQFATGCSSSITGSVLVRALPVPTLSYNAPLCMGSTLSLQATGGGVPYLWSGPNSFTAASQNANLAVVTASAQGLYTLSATDVFGCSGQDTLRVEVLGNPVVTATGTSVCSGQPAVLLSAGAVSYSWTGPGGYNSAVQNTTISPATNTLIQNYTVIGTAANSCTAAATATLEARPNPVATAVGTTVCFGAPATLTASGGVNYSWTGPNSFTSTLQNATLASVTNLAADIYTVLVTAANSCTDVTTATLTTKPNPVVSASVQPVCLNQSATLTANANTAGVTYAWTGPAGYSAAGATATIVSASSAAQQVYTVVGTAPNSCTHVTTANLNTFPLPTVTATGTLICFNQPFTLLGSGATTYTWNGPGIAGTVNTASVFIPTVNAQSMGNYTLIGTGANTCTNMAVASINTLALPTIVANGTTVCFGQPATLKANGGILSGYSWTGPGNYSANQANAFIASANNTSAGIYTVVGTAPNTCTNMATAVLNYYNLPIPTVTVPARVCMAQSIPFNASGADSYTWTGPYNFMTTAPGYTLPVYNPGQQGTYTLSVLDSRGCFNFTTFPIKVDPAPEGVLVCDNVSPCLPYCGLFRLRSADNAPMITSYRWEINRSTFYSSPSFNYCVNSATNTVMGSFTNALGCTSKFDLSAGMPGYPSPEASFDFLPFNPVEDVDQVNFTNTSTGEKLDRWQWYAGAGNATGNDRDFTHLFENAGTYPVVLVVSNTWGCSDTIIKNVIVSQDYRMYVPDAFTPNGDRLNDIFMPKGRGVKKYELTIYDSWGRLLFRTDDFYKGWDGTQDEKNIEEGVYNWRIVTTDWSGRINELAGHVMLIR